HEAIGRAPIKPPAPLPSGEGGRHVSERTKKEKGAAPAVRRLSEDGAQKRTRTSTAFQPLAPEASASTNSAIWAQGFPPGRRGPLREAARVVNSHFAENLNPAIIGADRGF